MPAKPDDLGPGAGEDALGVRMSFAVRAELAVAVVGQFVGVSGVAGEGAHDVSQSGIR